MDRRWNKNTVSLLSSVTSDPSANLLNHFNSHMVPCPDSFNGNWEEEVSTRKKAKIKMSDGHRSGTSTGRVSCKSTEVKRCNMTEMRWNKYMYKVSFTAPV